MILLPPEDNRGRNNSSDDGFRKSSYEKALENLDKNKYNSIPRGAGRPDRDNPITDDEVMNVIIDLNTTNDVNEFLERIR